MKRIAFAMLLVGTVIGSAAAMANADDTKWIAQCITDNSDAKVDASVVTKYCTCMNDKMSDNETRTITQWEKTHPKEEAQCDKESGWK